MNRFPASPCALRTPRTRTPLFAVPMNSHSTDPSFMAFSEGPWPGLGNSGFMILRARPDPRIKPKTLPPNKAIRATLELSNRAYS